MMLTELTVAPSVTAFCSTDSPLASRPYCSTGSVYWICSGMLLAAAGDPGGVIQRAGLDVHVEPGDPECGDHLLIVGRDRLYVRARVGDLGAAMVGAVSAE